MQRGGNIYIVIVVAFQQQSSNSSFVARNSSENKTNLSGLGEMVRAFNKCRLLLFDTSYIDIKYICKHQIEAVTYSAASLAKNFRTETPGISRASSSLHLQDSDIPISCFPGAICTPTFEVLTRCFIGDYQPFFLTVHASCHLSQSHFLRRPIQLSTRPLSLLNRHHYPCGTAYQHGLLRTELLSTQLRVSRWSSPGLALCTICQTHGENPRTAQLSKKGKPARNQKEKQRRIKGILKLRQHLSSPRSRVSVRCPSLLYSYLISLTV